MNPDKAASASRAIALARSLRHAPTTAEAALWWRLRNRQLNGYRFRRQHPMGSFIVDFCCLECQLVVEVDGDTHAEQFDHDARRTVWLQAQGYEVIRFWNYEVRDRLDWVLETILAKCETRKKAPSP